MAGIAPGGALTFFASPKKVSKEKRAAVRALRVPCAARSGRGRVQTRFAQTSTRPDPPAAALLSPARTAGDHAGHCFDRPGNSKPDVFRALSVGFASFFLSVLHQRSHQRRVCGLGRFGERSEYEPRPADPPLVPQAFPPRAPARTAPPLVLRAVLPGALTRDPISATSNVKLTAGLRQYVP